MVWLNPYQVARGRMEALAQTMQLLAESIRLLGAVQLGMVVAEELELMVRMVMVAVVAVRVLREVLAVLVETEQVLQEALLELLELQPLARV
jgi:hypothetical protein